MLLWGLDGWKLPPPAIRPPGTTQRDLLARTPMHRADDAFVVRLSVPRGSKLDAAFNLTRTPGGGRIDVWHDGTVDALERPLTSDTVITVQGTARLPAHGGERAAIVAWWTLVLLFALLVASALLAVRALRRSGWSGAHPDAAAIVGVMVFAAVTRVLLLAIGYLWVTVRAHPDVSYLGIDFHHTNQFLEPFARPDVANYFDIATAGYDAGPFRTTRQANWAYYPLWPLVLRALRFTFGSLLIPGMIASTALFVAAVGVLYALVRQRFEPGVARDTVVLLTVFPGTYFTLRPGPEALFLLLTVAAFFFADRRRWLLAGGVAALATVTRVQGVLLLLPLLFMYLVQWRDSRRHDWRALSLALIPAALGTFMLFLWERTGTPLASVRIQQAWGNGPTFPFDWLIRFLREPHILAYYGWDLAPLSAILTLLALAGFVLMLRRPAIPTEYAIYVALSLYLMVTRDNTNAASRFLVQLFPLFLLLALLLRQRPLMRDGVLVTFAIVQMWAFLSFVEGRNWAGT